MSTTHPACSFFEFSKISCRFPRPSVPAAAMVKKALWCGTAAPQTATPAINPMNRRGRVLPHSTDPTEAKRSPGNPAGAHGVTILRRHFRKIETADLSVTLFFFFLRGPICNQGTAFVGRHETSRFRTSVANRSEY